MRTRAPPAPTLKNVLVSHPSSAAQGTVAAPDEFLTTAMLAADDNHDLARPRGVLARVTRKWHNLWHRRSSSRRRDQHPPAPNQPPGVPANALSALRLRRARQMLTAPDPGATVESTQVAPFHAPSAATSGTNVSADHAGIRTEGGAPQAGNTVESTQPQQVIALPYHPTSPTTAAASSVAQHAAADNPILQPQYSMSSQQLKTPFSIAPATSQVVLSRERRLRAEREEQMALERAADDDLLDELNVSSSLSREPPRRVRQVGARVDDDILLELPRVDPVSLSLSETGVPGRVVSPMYHHHQNAPLPVGGMGMMNNDLVSRHTPKVRQLPRVSGLMPTRAVRAPSADSGSGPGGSEQSPHSGGTSSRRNSRGRVTPIPYDDHRSAEDSSEGRYDDHEEEDDDSGDHYDEEDEESTPIHFDENNHDADHFVDEENVDREIEDDDMIDEDDEESETAVGAPVQGNENAESGTQPPPPPQQTRIPRAPRMRRLPIARLPTGMSRRDVERAMERAVVEIASDGDDSSDNNSINSASDVVEEDGLSGEQQVEDEGNKSQNQTQGKGLGVASTDRGDDDDATQRETTEDACHSSAKSGDALDNTENTISGDSPVKSMLSTARAKWRKSKHRRMLSLRGESSDDPITRALESEQQEDQQGEKDEMISPSKRFSLLKGGPNHSKSAGNPVRGRCQSDMQQQVENGGMNRSVIVSPSPSSSLTTSGNLTPEHQSDVLSRRVTSAACTRTHEVTDPLAAVPFNTQPSTTAAPTAAPTATDNQIANGIINLNLNLGALSFGLVGFGRYRMSQAKAQSKQQQEHDTIGAGGTSTAAAYLAASDVGFPSASQSSSPSSPTSQSTSRGRRYQQNNDVALFEDDYLSFQGFHSSTSVESSSWESGYHNPGSSLRAYYAGMSLLRPKRISSVTDSHSDESVSVENANRRPGAETRARSESLSRRNQRYRVVLNGRGGTRTGGVVLHHRSNNRRGAIGGQGMSMRGRGREQHRSDGARAQASRSTGSATRSGRLPMLLNLRKWSALEEQAL